VEGNAEAVEERLTRRSINRLPILADVGISHDNQNEYSKRCQRFLS
jgi:hypothetical protein